MADVWPRCKVVRRSFHSRASSSVACIRLRGYSPMLSAVERGREAAADGVQPLALRLSPGPTRMIVFPLILLGRVEGWRTGIVEGRRRCRCSSALVRPVPADDLTQLGTIGLDNEVDRHALGRPRLARPDDDSASSSSNHACGPLPDVASDEIEHQIDAGDVFQGVVLEVDELLRAEVECLLTIAARPVPMT